MGSRHRAFAVVYVYEHVLGNFPGLSSIISNRNEAQMYWSVGMAFVLTMVLSSAQVVQDSKPFALQQEDDRLTEEEVAEVQCLFRLSAMFRIGGLDGEDAVVVARASWWPGEWGLIQYREIGETMWTYFLIDFEDDRMWSGVMDNKHRVQKSKRKPKATRPDDQIASLLYDTVANHPGHAWHLQSRRDGEVLYIIEQASVTWSGVGTGIPFRSMSVQAEGQYQQWLVNRSNK